MTNIVQLDVGGTIFKTTKPTLTKFDGYFRTMFETGIPVAKDESDAIFIDRGPKHFRRILNFMRDGHVDLPNVPEDVSEIQKEAEFFLLLGLVELCKTSQASEYESKTKKQELEYPNKLRFIKSDEELFEVTYKPEKPVLVLFGPIRPEGYIEYPDDLDLLEFQKKYATKFEIYIRLKPFSDDMRSWNYDVYSKKVHIGHEFGRTSYTFTEQLENAIQEFFSRENW